VSPDMRLSWRKRLAVLSGLLIPIPLALLLASVLVQRPPPLTHKGRPVSPVLAFEERLRLQSYHRECTRRTDCEPPLGCLSDTRVRRTYCADSECVTDIQCPDGFACLPLPTVDDGPLVRYCIPPGLRKEGERCLPIPREPDHGCEVGLLCGADWCGRPCRLEDPTSCPSGFFCADTVPGPACRPTCEGRTCPEGQRCIRDQEGASACAVVHGPDCQHIPCPEGRKCLGGFGIDHPGHVWMTCYPECGEGLPSCPESFVCDRGSCRRRCDPVEPDTCELGFQCRRRDDDQPWLCRPGS
jgi:hypothetical protein